MKRFFLINLALTILFAGGGNTAYGQRPLQLVWSDEFNTGSALDSSVWSYDLGDSGWGNQELQDYTRQPENVRVEDGNLVITVKKSTDGGDIRFTSGRVKTQDKLTFKYGRIEARIKMPNLADGLWPAFWTLGQNWSQVGWPACGELDIVEMGSGDAISQGLTNQRVGSAAHWDNNGYWASYNQFLNTNMDVNDDYHIFALDWTPEKVTTYIDGQQVWTMRIQQDQCSSCSEFHLPHFMILNVAVGGTYTGLMSPDRITAGTPAEMLVDYVRVYDNGFTELGGSAIEEGPFPGQEFLGSWFNEDQDGHGFSIAFGRLQNGSPIAVVYWYIYDEEGSPIFLVGTGNIDGSTLDIQFESPRGMVYGEFDKDTVVREHGGTARIVFTDTQNATFSYTPSAFSVTTWGHSAIESLPLKRLFTVPVTDTSATTN